MPQDTVTLVYNGNCSTCSILAKQANEYSKQKIEVIPFHSEVAKEKLRVFYPDGIPFDYYLIETDSVRSHCRSGKRAALRLPKYLGYLNSIKLLRIFLHYQGHSTMPSERIMAPVHTGIPENPIMNTRRGFVRVAAAGVVAVLLIKAGLSGLSSSAQSSVNASASSFPPYANYVIKSDKKGVSLSIPEGLKNELKLQYARNVAAGRPLDPVSVNVPDCIAQCYPCGYGIYCFDCWGFSCVACCHAGCEIRCISACMPTPCGCSQCP